MGRTKTIEEKMAEDKKFRDFMDNLEVESKKIEDKILADVDATVKKHYDENGWDHARLFGNKQSEYQNYDDWNLNRIMNIIDSIGTALEGGDFPSKAVPGSDKAAKSTIDNAKDFLGAFAGDYSLIISRVKALISGVLSQFAVASNITRKTDLRDMPLSGGLHLFFGSYGSVYTSNTFFTNQYIGSFQIVFVTYMSVKEAQSIALQQLLATTEQELTMLNKMIIDIRKMQVADLNKVLKDKPQDFLSTKATYDVMLAGVKLDIDTLMQQYNKYNQVTTAVDQMLSEIDLSDADARSLQENPLIHHLFNDWEAGIARRYIKEKVASKKESLILN